MNARAMIRIGGALLLLAMGAERARAEEDHFLAVAGRDDHVEIVVHGASIATGASAVGRGIWIDVPLAGVPKGAARITVSNDRTIKRAEVVLTGEQPRLSILLHHDMKGAEYAGNAVVEQSPAGVVLRVPREPDHKPVPYVAPPVSEAEYGPMPEPRRAALATPPRRAPVDPGLAANSAAAPSAAASPRAAAPAAVAPRAAAAAVASHAEPANTTAVAPRSVAATPSVVVAPAFIAALDPAEPVAGAARADGVAPAPIAAGVEPAALLDEHPLASTRDEGRTALFGVLLLLSLCGIAVLLMARRRRAELPDSQLLRVVSTCHLSAKVRVVLVAIGDRQLLLSVSEQGARVLARWRVGPRNERVTLDLDDGAQTVDNAAIEESLDISYAARGPAVSAGSAGSDRSERRDLNDLPDIDIDLDLDPGPMSAARGAELVQAARGPFASPFSSFMPRPSSPSPAVAGLLKLRRRGAEEVASGDPAADEEWARDLLSAMRSGPEAVR